MKRCLRRVAIAIAALIVGVVLLGVVTSQGRAAVRTALFIPQVLPAIPIKPQEWVTRAPVWRSVQYTTADGEGTADLILPASSGKHSGVLFFLGVVVNPPRDDQRIVALAEGLARSGMVVMIPWSETQLQRRVMPEDIDDLVWAFQYLQSVDSIDPEKVGMGGICTGASMAMVAAQDERIRNDVKFVNFFAGYYDAYDFFKAISSRSRFYGDYVASWDTDGLSLEVFRNHLIDSLTDDADRDLLIRIYRNKEAGAEAEVDSLSPEGMAAYRIIEGVPFEEFDALAKQLSPQTTEFLRRISPSTNIGDIKARVLVMHDRADRLVPSEESRRLSEALADRADTYYTEFSLFQKEIQLHVDQDVTVGPLDFTKEAYKLFLHMYNIMRDIS